MRTPQAAIARTSWQDALLAADLIALDPTEIGGIVVRAPAGPVRDAWLDYFCSNLPQGTPVRRLPLNATPDRILGGLDLAATLAAGRRVIEKGVLAEADGGYIIMPMAERWRNELITPIVAALDLGQVLVEREGLQASMPAHLAVIAFDEGTEDDDRPPFALLDRLALHVDLRFCSAADIAETNQFARTVATPGASLGSTQSMDAEVVRALCATASALGIPSLRAALFAGKVAQLHARICGRDTASDDDAAVAARLVLVPRATTVPQQAGRDDDHDELQPKQSESGSRQSDANREIAADQVSAITLEDRLVAAALASLPKDILQAVAIRNAGVSRGSSEGKVGIARRSSRRGRVVGSQSACRDRMARLNVLATLRAAAPWQRLRHAEARAVDVWDQRQNGVVIRRSDFRVNAYKNRSGSTIIFAVDASGSSALHRLAEAKGAVELLLADCYARRDSVALISFRGNRADVLLALSRSLARAKRSLAGLPGGGGTPLVAGIEAGRAVADTARRKGDTPLLILMTDGRANVTREGVGGRAEAEGQAIAAARGVRAAGIGTLLIDTSPQPHPFAAVIAKELGGRYVPLPHADAGTISETIERERINSTKR